MVEVDYRGGNYIVITTKDRTIHVDANVDMIGLKNANLKDGVQLATEGRFLIKDAEGLKFEGPGDYETGGIAIHGIAANQHLDDPEAGKTNATIYRVEAGDIRLGIIGNITAPLSELQLEELGVIDVLVVPVGGNGYTLDATSAAELTRQIESKAIIPVHYHDEAIKYQVNQDEVSVFTQELGSDTEERDSLKFKSASALPQTTTVYLLNRK